jgi:chromate transporter
VGLLGLFVAFFKLGATSWGGFALMAAARNTFVTDRRLVTPQQYADALALAWLMPGPVGSNLAVRLGYLMRGRWGAVVAGTGALLPSAIAICVLAQGYRSVQSHHSVVSALLSGLSPAICAVIIGAALGQAKTALTDRLDAALAVAAALGLLAFKGALVPVLLLGCAAAASAGVRGQTPLVPPSSRSAAVKPSRGVIACLVLLSACVLTLPFPSLLRDTPAWFQLPAGLAGASLSMFGGGLIAVPVLHQLCVESFGWTTAAGLTSAIAASQISPGPLLTSTIFIGYQTAGITGALGAAAGTFGPPGLLTLCAGFGLTAMRGSARFEAAMRGVRAAVVGLTVASAWQIAQGSALSWITLAIFALSLLLLLKSACKAYALVPLSGLAGVLLHL